METCLNLLGVRHILSGPFTGTRYTHTSYGSAYYPKIFGTYEKELFNLWTFENLKIFQTIVDIGCAEGYYLAGISHILSQRKDVRPKLIGYDINASALEEAARLLDLNKVYYYQLKTSGYERDLAIIKQPSLLICDTEGNEREILNPNEIKSLLRMHILVEVHDEPNSNDTFDLLKKRFSSSHHITLYVFQDRSIHDFPRLKWPRISDNLKMKLIHEGRKYGKCWLFMKPL